MTLAGLSQGARAGSCSHTNTEAGPGLLSLWRQALKSSCKAGWGRSEPPSGLLSLPTSEALSPAHLAFLCPGAERARSSLG